MPHKVDVVIPARNEGDTIGGVVSAFLLNPVIGNIIVVSNKSEDDTIVKAMQNGAFVLEQNKVDGKGQTLKVGLDYVETERVLFFDADLRGPIAKYIPPIANPATRGMIIGVTDFPALSPVPWNVPRTVFKHVSGQRSLPAQIARSIDLHGYCVEVQVNRAILESNLPIRFVHMKGVKGKIRKNSVRMAELRRDQRWLRENWK